MTKTRPVRGSAHEETVRHLAALLEWAKGNRGRKNQMPYEVEEVKAALKHLARLEGLPPRLTTNGANLEWLDVDTVALAGNR